MILIVCLDMHDGMRFNRRRQSTDKDVIARILDMFGDDKIAVRPCSEKLFSADRITVPGNPLESDVYFAEEICSIPPPNAVEKLVVFRWDKIYPADEKFPMKKFLEEFSIKESVSFPGNSHDTITLEVYER